MMASQMVAVAEKRHLAKAEKSVINKAVHALGGEHALWAAIASGVTVQQWCREQGVSDQAFYDWIEKEPERALELTRARARAADSFAESGLDLIKQAETPVEIRKAEVQGKYGQWLAKCWNRDVYGDAPQVQLNISTNEMHIDALRNRSKP